MDVITELQQQRESLKQNIHDMDENIKKLTGRDPTESRRLSATKRIQLKRNSFGTLGDNQPIKRLSTEKRRWGSTAMNRANNLDSGGEEQEEKKPAVQSSVVVTGKPIEPPRLASEDNATKKRNKRMFGLLMSTLKDFKRESQVKTTQEARQEEKLIKVEEQVQKDKDDAVVERRELFQTRRGKQQELRNLEFKIEMAELNEELKSHYDHIKDSIQLKSTPRIFYKPAEHNERTSNLLKESQEGFKESLHHRMKEISMCTEEDMISNTRTVIRRSKQFVGGKSAKDPIIIDQAPSKRDLFAEDADIDQQEQVQVIVEEEAEVVMVTDEQRVEDLPVVVIEPMNEPVNIEEINSEVDGIDKELRSPVSNSEKHVLGLHILAVDKNADVQECDSLDEHGGGDVDKFVEGGGDIDGFVKGHSEEGEAIQEHAGADENVLEHANIVVEHAQGCDDVDEHAQGGGDFDQVGCEQGHESSVKNKDESAVANDDHISTKTDDSFLHDEYAAQLLEQVVDEGRVVGSGNSYDVVDERLNLSNEQQNLQDDTKLDITASLTSIDNITTVVTGIDTTVEVKEEEQQGIESSQKEDRLLQ